MQKSQLKIKALWLLGILYITTTLPILTVFVKDEYIRFINYNRIGHWKGKLLGLENVFCGDSITAAGRSWSMRLTGTPFNSVNLSGSAYTAAQIRIQVSQAKNYSPRNLFIMAGTNDILEIQSPFDLETFRNDYQRLLDVAVTCAPGVYVTLIPYTADEERTVKVTQANQVIAELCQEKGVWLIDINDTVAPRGLLLSEYTKDGVHLNSKGINIWQEKIEAVLNP